MKQSIINWQTGEPKESCCVLISVKNRKGEVFTATDSWNIYYENGITIIGKEDLKSSLGVN